MRARTRACTRTDTEGGAEPSSPSASTAAGARPRARSRVLVCARVQCGRWCARVQCARVFGCGAAFRPPGGPRVRPLARGGQGSTAQGLRNIGFKGGYRVKGYGIRGVRVARGRTGRRARRGGCWPTGPTRRDSKHERTSANSTSTRRRCGGRAHSRGVGGRTSCCARGGTC